ncbi:11891_t:CDS:1, partial [Racocetra persica]
IDKTVKLPRMYWTGDTAVDLFSPNKCVVLPNSSIILNTKQQIKILDRYRGVLKTRSSIGFLGVFVFEGLIDSNYTSELKIKIFNTSDEPFEITTSNAVAQMTIEKYEELKIEEVDEFETTARNELGFGSSNSENN